MQRIFWAFRIMYSTYFFHMLCALVIVFCMFFIIFFFFPLLMWFLSTYIPSIGVLLTLPFLFLGFTTGYLPTLTLLYGIYRQFSVYHLLPNFEHIKTLSYFSFFIFLDKHMQFCCLTNAHIVRISPAFQSTGASVSFISGQRKKKKKRCAILWISATFSIFSSSFIVKSKIMN